MYFVCMYSSYSTPDYALPNVSTAGAQKLAVGRIPVNGIYDKTLAMKGRRLHINDKDMDVVVGDPVFTIKNHCFNGELYVFSCCKAIPIHVPSEINSALQQIVMRHCYLENLRFIGFSETDIQCENRNKMDINICVNTGGSLTVLCGEEDGIRTNDAICIDLPKHLWCDETDSGVRSAAKSLSGAKNAHLVNRLVVRRFDKVKKDLDTLDQTVAKE